MRKRFARVAMDPDRHFTSDGFSLDLAHQRLVCNGEVVALTPKAFAAGSSMATTATGPWRSACSELAAMFPS